MRNEPRAIATMITAAALLAACASSRETPGDYELVVSDSIPASAVPALTDCVHDAFKDRTIGLGVMLTTRVLQRSNMTRVETVSGDFGAVLSADIFQSGKVELYETAQAVRGRVEKERQAFSNCIKTHK